MGIVNVIPAVLIGCYIGARDYRNRTASSAVHWGGRYGPLAGKAVATFVVLTVFVVATGVLGFLLGLAHDTTMAHIDILELLEQLALGILTTAAMGLLALTVATLVRNLAVANLVCLVVLFGQMFLPSSVGQAIRFANPLTFVGVFADPAFSNLSGLTNVAVSFSSDLGVSQSIFGLVIYVACCLTALSLVARFREYR